MIPPFLKDTTITIVIGLTLATNFPLWAQESPTLLSGFTDDEIFAIEDGRPLFRNDQNLARLLYRSQKSSLNTLDRFGKQNGQVALSDIHSDPRSYRCYLFQFSGYIRAVSRWKNAFVEDESAGQEFDLLQFEHEELDCLIAVPRSGRPTRWPLNENLDEPASFTGFFLGNFDFHPDNDPTNAIWMDTLQAKEYPVFVAREIEWYPISESDRFEVTESELLLSRHGVNISRLDHVRKNVLGKIGNESALSFLQTLGASARISNDQFPSETIDFKTCLQFPARHQSAPMMLRGQIRRVTRIAIEDPFQQAISGLNSYYQLDLFVPLDGHKIVFRSAESDQAQANSHENRFPVTVCVAQLPPSTESLEKKQVVIPCFFFQRWKYISQKSTEQNTLPFQDAPLAIGLKPMLVPEPESPLNLWIGIFAVISCLGLSWLYWMFGSRSSAKPNTGGEESLPDQIDTQGFER